MTNEEIMAASTGVSTQPDPNADPAGEGAPDPTQDDDKGAGEGDAGTGDAGDPSAAGQKDNHETRRWNKILRENAELRGRNALAEQLLKQGGQQPPAAQQPQQQEINRDDFASDAEFIAAVTRQEIARTAPKIAESASRAQEEQRLASEFAGKQEDARKRYADYDDVLNVTIATIPPHLEAAMLRSEHGADILYYLAKNPAEAARLGTMHPNSALVALGKVEGTIEANKKRAPKVSGAPAPFTPVGSRTSGGAPDLNKMSMAEFAKYETERLHKLGRRK